MALNLLEAAQNKTKLHSLDVIERDLWDAPQKYARFSQWMAWACDWVVAGSISASLVEGWSNFIAPLTYFQLPYSMEDNFLETALKLPRILTPVIHFALSYLTLAHQGQTFGQKLFGVQVSGETSSLSWQEALYQALGTTVASVTAGFSVFWVDQLALTQTTTTAWGHWHFTHAHAPLEAAPIDLVAQAQSHSAFEEDFKLAA